MHNCGWDLFSHPCTYEDKTCSVIYAQMRMRPVQLTMHNCRLAPPSTWERGALYQTEANVILGCPIHWAPIEYNKLLVLDKDTWNWLKNIVARIWKVLTSYFIPQEGGKNRKIVRHQFFEIIISRKTILINQKQKKLKAKINSLSCLHVVIYIPTVQNSSIVNYADDCRHAKSYHNLQLCNCYCYRVASFSCAST